MIEIRTILNDAQELEWFQQLYAGIEKYRKHLAAANEIQGPPPVAGEETGNVTDSPSDEDNPTSHQGAMTPAEIAAADGVKVPTDAELIEGLTAYYQAKGFPAARQLLTEFGVDRIIDIADPAQKVAALARMAL